MLVKDRMSRELHVVTSQTSVPEALAMMESKGIRRLPVVDKEKLAGIVTLLDLMRASPSPATSLSIWELNYLLAKLPVKDIMVKKLITVAPDVPIDEAAKLMREHRIGGLPVVQNGKLVGMITETDIFTAFLEMLGVNRGGVRLSLELPDRPGVLAEVSELLYALGINVISLAVMPSDPAEGICHSVWRLQGCKDVKGLLEKLDGKGYHVVHVSANDPG
ncbi:MAG: CBS domain-containing protein [Dethiobacter sp.]|jgi:acetoin utilization protein AcuB|nr:CBS domain-containing protein [Dethiobacter sp.]